MVDEPPSASQWFRLRQMGVNLVELRALRPAVPDPEPGSP